jgi:hypothetical protein
VEEDRVTRAARQLRELKAAGVELHELLGNRVGAEFIRDHCGGDFEVAYAAIALVYCPTTHEKRAGEQGKVDGAERHHDHFRIERDPS